MLDMANVTAFRELNLCFWCFRWILCISADILAGLLIEPHFRVTSNQHEAFLSAVITINHLISKHRTIGPNSWHYRLSAAWARHKNPISGEIFDVSDSHKVLTLKISTWKLAITVNYSSFHSRNPEFETASRFSRPTNGGSSLQAFLTDSAETGHDNCDSLLTVCSL